MANPLDIFREDRSTPRVMQDEQCTPYFIERMRKSGIPIATNHAYIQFRLAGIFTERDEALVEFGIADEITGEWLITWGKMILSVGDTAKFQSEGVIFDWEKLVHIDSVSRR